MTNPELDRIRFVAGHFNDLQGLRFRVPAGLSALGVAFLTGFAGRGLVLLGAVLLVAAVVLMLGARRYYPSHFGEVEPPREAEILSIYNLAGTSVALADSPRTTPLLRRLLLTMGLAAAVFLAGQSTTPTVVLVEDSIAPQYREVLEAYRPEGSGVVWMKSATPFPLPRTGAGLGQLALVLCGSLFLGLWFWRGRHPAQSCQLALAVPLLGLAAFGTFLEKLISAQGLADQAVRFFLPVVSRPGVALLVCGSALILSGLLDHRQLVRGMGEARG
ncbi:MAG TPA: hypothetical protein VHN15_00735 [Thermoanaerobaculia bacterium]|nr:hypothetical protein [Thermoanaerobaculia bacterium]